ncbi:conserved hypothetical protein [Treponema primitia ZAS-2]|uniref:DUF3786 domain-containing protein n=1 Tax=Treponema primitia (strain ATCC BAA-887 / DSM 12427 / ZAS-2) TaxID=545694 RepID=F5YMN5_TREPZ|nr:DUF3786 domain-containing protein [Treponema primitia]AEF85925.1 conserved hypothetical protein [Treponema primitia ZAS-2]
MSDEQGRAGGTMAALAGGARTEIKNQKEGVPLAHYQGLYRTRDPLEIGERCGLVYEKTGEGEGAFPIRLLGTEYKALYPEFELQDDAGKLVTDPYEKILLLRYLCEGKFFASRGKQLSYNEVPWGQTYYRNFEGRCLKRLAFTFGNDLEGFRQIVEAAPGLRAEALDKGDVGYRFEFISGLFMSVLIWAGDEEFPPSAQILFDDNFVFAFTAEDMAVVGEVVIRRFKGMKK